METMHIQNHQNLKLVAGRDTIVRDSSGLMIDVSIRNHGRLNWRRSNGRAESNWSWQDNDAIARAA